MILLYVKRILFLFIFLLSKVCFAQSKLSGLLTDKNNKPIPLVNVLIKKDSSSLVVAYAYTDNKGKYIIEIPKTGIFNVTFSSLGFDSETVTLKIDDSKNENIIDVTLKERLLELDEVFIKAEKPISIKKDTITFKTMYFIKGNEVSVEDLLKNIPGLNIDSEGTIKIGNQEIEKLMIDGDDFFEKGYKILSKNMPAHPIEEVEVLKHYSNNRLLKNIENSNKVALNLKLKEDAKRIWFGNIETGYNFNNRYEFRGNLMNFGKKNKYYFLTNLNNVGVDAIGEVNDLIRPYRFNEAASIGDNQQVNNLLDLSSSNLNFKKSRINFNNAELISLNAIFNPTEKLKIKTLGFLNWDETDFFRNSTNIVNTNDVNFTNSEDFKLRNKKRISFGKIDITYYISKTKMLETTTKYNEGNTKGNSNLLFNGASTIENLQSNNTLFNQKISYTNKFKNKQVFLLTGRFIDEKTPQTYNINQFFYQELFPNFANANNVQQQSQNQMQFAGFEAHLLNRKKNDDLLEFKIGNEYRKDKLKTAFTLFEDTFILDSPEDFQNNTIYQTNDLYFKSKYRHKIKDVAVISKINIHQLFNSLGQRDNESSQNQNLFFINPNIGMSWKINENNKVTSSYSYTTTNVKILDVYDNFVLTGFRSFSKGASSFNQLESSSLVFNYQLGNWSDRFFSNTILLYTKNFDFFSNNTLISQNFTQSERIIIKDREFLSVYSKFDYYINKISSNVKLDLSYSKSNYKNIINNSDLRVVKSNNYTYGAELRSGFKGIFNYHFGTKWTTNEIKTTKDNSFTNNLIFLDLSFVFNDKFNIQFQTERYFFGNLNTDNTYYFLDFDARYTVKKNKLSFALTGKNLFNTEKFRNFSISDIGTSTTEYRLLERFVLLKFEYRF